MAVSNPARYPEFAGNVKSVDTREFHRPAAQSPSADSWCYNKNAESFLRIGKALGRAMLDMLNGNRQANP